MNITIGYILKRTAATLFVMVNALLCGIGFAVLSNLIFPGNKYFVGLFILGLPILALIFMLRIYKNEYQTKVKQKSDNSTG